MTITMNITENDMNLLIENNAKKDETKEEKKEVKKEVKEEDNEESKKEEDKRENEKIINGWSKRNQTYFRYCLHRLKYYRIINNFFFFQLKKREGKLSWAIIVLSSVSTLLSTLNTQTDLFPYFIKIIQWALIIITFTTTLISSYIKKQQFIDRINNIDRYLQQLTQTVEEMNVTFILEPEKRENYDEFCKKYIPLIKNLSVSPASFSPIEWKRTVYTITKDYPELIEGDGTNEELLWPWYYMETNEVIKKVKEDRKRSKSSFGDIVIDSYNHTLKDL